MFPCFSIANTGNSTSATGICSRKRSDGLSVLPLFSDFKDIFFFENRFMVFFSIVHQAISHSVSAVGSIRNPFKIRSSIIRFHTVLMVDGYFSSAILGKGWRKKSEGNQGMNKSVYSVALMGKYNAFVSCVRSILFHYLRAEFVSSDICSCWSAYFASAADFIQKWYGAVDYWLPMEDHGANIQTRSNGVKC